MSGAARSHDEVEELKARLTDEIGRLTEALLGKPTGGTKARPRWGRNGSLEVVVSGAKRGSWVSRKGGGGGPLQLIMHAKSCGFVEAKQWAREWLGGCATWTPRRRAETEAPPKAEQSTYHLKIAHEAVAATGTLAEHYLRKHRGIIGELPPEARFHPKVWHKESKRSWPAAIFVASDASGIRRIQAVFLDPATAQKASIKPNKKTYGAAASHVPVVFAGRHAGGPICIAEGPEDAATIWSLTGHPTMATLGSGSLAKPILAPGAHVQLCGDSTDEGRKAAREAARQYVEAGCRVELAFASDGLKDFNEALQKLGPQRTLEMLCAASPFRGHGLHPYYPAAVEARDQALRRQQEAIETVIKSGALRGFANREIELRVAARIEPDMSPAAKGAVRRKVKAEIATEIGKLPPQLRLLVSGAQGTGKTQTALKTLASLVPPPSVAGNLVVHAYEPFLQKCFDLASDYKKLATRESLPIKVLLGRNAPDPLAPAGTAMCPRHEVVTRAAERGVQVRKDICSSCKFSDTCGYMRQEQEIEAMGERGVFVHAHGYLGHPTPAPSADLVIIDESAVLGAVADAVEMSPSAVVGALVFKGSDLANHMRASSTVAEIVTALKTPTPLKSLRAVGLTVEDIRFVHDMIDDAIEAAKPNFSGKMSDAALAQTLDNWVANDLGRVSALLSALRREFDAPRDTLTGIVFDPARRVRVDDREEVLPRIRVHRMRTMANVQNAATLLLLDGTGDPMLNRQVFGAIEHVHTPIERDAFVIGTSGKSYSRQSLTGLDRGGRQLAHRADDAQRLRQEIRTITHHVSDMAAGRPGIVVATKRTAEMLRADHVMPDAEDVAHFGKVRGLNTWEDCAWGVVVGRESLSVEGLEDLTRALFATDPQPFVSFAAPPPADWPLQCWPFRATRGRRMRDGSVQPVEVEVHPDLRCQAVLEQIREAEILQAADRTRPIFNHRKLALLNDLVVDVTYDRCWRHDRLVAGGSRFDLAWQASGIIPLTPTELHRAFPKFFPSISSAKDALAGVGKRGGASQIRFYLGNPPAFSFRRPGQRGSPSRILIDPLRHPDPMRVLQAVFGAVEDVHAMSTGKPAPGIAKQPASSAQPGAVELPQKPLEVSGRSLQALPATNPGAAPLAPTHRQRPLLLLFVKPTAQPADTGAGVAVPPAVRPPGTPPAVGPPPA